MQRDPLGTRAVRDQQVRGASVQRGKPRRRQLRRKSLGDDRMDEGQRSSPRKQIGRAQRVRCRLDLIPLQARERGRVAQRTARAEDSYRLCEPLTIGTQARKTHEHRPTDRAGAQRPDTLRKLEARALPLSRERQCELPQVKRVPAGRLPARSAQLAVGAGAQAPADERDARILAERRDPQLPAAKLEERAECGSRPERVPTAHRDHQQHRKWTHPSREICEKPRRRVVKPLPIINE